jgi:hypothetical protein
MNEDEYRIHEMKERRNDKAASYDKPQVVRRKGWTKADNKKAERLYMEADSTRMSDEEPTIPCDICNIEMEVNEHDESSSAPIYLDGSGWEQHDYLVAHGMKQVCQDCFKYEIEPHYCDWCGGIKNPKAEDGPFKPRQLCDCGK